MQHVIYKAAVQGSEPWHPLMNEMTNRGHVVQFIDPIPENRKAELTIVLSGKMENPYCASNKRVVVFDKGEWFPSPHKWNHMIAGILKHYYDDMWDITGLTTAQAADKIERCLKEMGSSSIPK